MSFFTAMTTVLLLGCCVFAFGLYLSRKNP